MSVIRCAYFYTASRTVNFPTILQGVLPIHIEKYKIFIVLDTRISTTKTYLKKIQRLTEGLSYRDYHHLILYRGKLLGAYVMLSFKGMDKKKWRTLFHV